MTNETTKRKIKILRIITRLNIGGPVIHAVILTRHMQDMGYETLLVTGQVGSEEGDMCYLAEAEGVKPVLLSELSRRLQLLNDLFAFARLLRVLRNFRPDIVHTHTGKAGALGRLAGAIYNLPRRFEFKSRTKSQHITGSQVIDSESAIPNQVCRIVHTYHGHVLRGYFSPIKSKLFQLIEKVLAKLTDVIVVVSEQQKHELCNGFGIGRPDQYRVIPLGLNLKSFCNLNRYKRKFRTHLRIMEEKTKLIGIVGRLTPIKNHRLFLEAVRLLMTDNGKHTPQFLIVGDGELRSDLENVTEQLALMNCVIFTGWLRDLASLYADLDILALTSENEGTPVAIIEAMTAEVPVIATNVGGVRELISERGLRDADLREGEFEVCERGILVKMGDGTGFAKGLKYLLDHPEVSKEMGKRGKEYALKNHSKERLISEMHQLYRSFMVQKKMPIEETKR
jgi:glycosyltransferase involved in cell wall biosynthesis